MSSTQKLTRQHSELCSLDWIDEKDDTDDDDGDARDGRSCDASVEPTPAKRVSDVRTPLGNALGSHLKVRISNLSSATDGTDDGASARKSARSSTSAFSVALDNELEQRHECHTPATMASAMPLHVAVARADAEATKALLSRGSRDADDDNDDTGGGSTWPPSKEALNRISSTSMLKEFRINETRTAVNARNEHGDTALHVASALERNSVEMVSILVKAGANMLVHSSSGYTASHWAASTGNVETLKLLAELCPNESLIIESRALDGSTPLLVAAAYGKTDVIEWLVNYKGRGTCNVFAVDSQGKNVLGVLGAKMGKKTQTAKATLRAKIFELIPAMRVAFLSHPDCEEHVSFKPHQESPERMTAIFEELKRVTERGELMLDELERLESFACAEPHEILFAHSEEYVRVLANLSEQVGHTPIAFTPYCQNQKGVPEKLRKPVENSDTFFSPGTLQAALRAAGGVLHAVDRVLENRNRSAFVCCRPPGHHAGVSGATEGAPSSGFSILNNAMIGALHAIEQKNVRRVAVVDFDVHHGNGTEEIARHWLQQQRLKFDFNRHTSPDLFFTSIHLADDGTSSGINFYPGTGVQDDVMNNIVNVVVPPMWIGKGASATANGEMGERTRKKAKRFGDDDEPAPAAASKTELQLETNRGGRLEWMKAFRERLIPSLRAFGPELIIVSAGFDAASGDIGNIGVDTKRGVRLQGVNLRPEDFEMMTTQIVDVANACAGHVVSVLEGGYGVLKDAELNLGRENFARCVQAHVKALCM